MNTKINSIIVRWILLPLMVALTACSTLANVNGSQSKTQAISGVTSTKAASDVPSVTVTDQDYDGTTVVVADAFSQGPGWMVIHNTVNGSLGPAIGWAHLNDGDNKNISVTIDPSQASPVMYAMLHTDAGVVGKYEYPGPDVPAMSNGGMISPAFKATVAPSLKTSASAATTPTSGSGYAAYPTSPATTGTAANTPIPTDSMGNMTSPYGGATPLVKVSDQPVFGGTVMVDDVFSSGPGWIVIYTTNANGQPDQIIGHTAVKDGDNQGVLVQVDPTKAVGTLYAQLHVDKGSVGTFEYPGMDAPVMQGVQMIASTFHIVSAQSTSGAATPSVLQASITVSDQAIQNGTVTVAQVVSNGNWWLVIHKQNPDGTLGEYIGATLLKNGINTNVVVTIDMTQVTPVLYAMLHEDHGVIGKLEFPGPDNPVMVNGQMVTPSFHALGLTQDVTINIQKVSSTVSYLTDGQGMSMYISIKDAPGKSNCTADCLALWKPVVVSGKVIAGAGVSVANLGVITLPDGTHQVAYLGAPLYTYVKDVNPGDTNGQGVGGVWFLVTPAQ